MLRYQRNLIIAGVVSALCIFLSGSLSFSPLQRFTRKPNFWTMEPAHRASTDESSSGSGTCLAFEQDVNLPCSNLTLPSTSERVQCSIERIYASTPCVHDWLHVIITFKNAKNQHKLQTKFALTVSSLLSLTSRPVIFFVIGDEASQEIAKSIIKDETSKKRISALYKVAELDAEQMAKELHEVVEPMQRRFSSKPGAYYSDSLFFLSIAVHRVLPESLAKVIMIDADLKFKSDISLLYDLFDQFEADNIIGIARENQPVYRHVLSGYRSRNKGTRAGEPPPDGLTGFNSGVLLLHLDRMRASELYNSLLNEVALEKLCGAYKFKGHLGDQDFFTVLSLSHEELFYPLPCGWNRQLCTYWRGAGYADIFDNYFRCDGPVHILHGNCDTPILD